MGKPVQKRCLGVDNIVCIALFESQYIKWVSATHIPKLAQSKLNGDQLSNSNLAFEGKRMDTPNILYIIMGA